MGRKMKTNTRTAATTTAKRMSRTAVLCIAFAFAILAESSSAEANEKARARRGTSRARIAFNASGKLITTYKPKIAPSWATMWAGRSHFRASPQQSTGWVVRSEEDGSALVMAARHAMASRGDTLKFGGVSGVVEEVLATNKNLDYALIRARLSEPIPPIEVSTKLPKGGGRVFLVGYPAQGRCGPAGKAIARGSYLGRGVELRKPWDSDTEKNVQVEAEAMAIATGLLWGPILGPQMGGIAGRAYGNVVAASVERKLEPRSVIEFKMNTRGGFSGGPIVDWKSGLAVAMQSCGTGSQGFGVPMAMIVEDIARKVDAMPSSSGSLVRRWLGTVK